MTTVDQAWENAFQSYLSYRRYWEGENGDEPKPESFIRDYFNRMGVHAERRSTEIRRRIRVEDTPRMPAEAPQSAPTGGGGRKVEWVAPIRIVTPTLRDDHY